MCGIAAGPNLKKTIETAIALSKRGMVAHSVSRYNKETSMIDQWARYPSSLTFGQHASNEISSQYYFIIHTQAPTGDTSEQNIHPAEERQMVGEITYMWHNGIIKAAEVKRLNKELSTDFTWDTALLLHAFNKNPEILSEIDGSFACMFMTKDGLLGLFRNEISPLFIRGEYMEISSENLDGSWSEIPANVVFIMDFKHQSLIPIQTFTTKHNPYFF